MHARTYPWDRRGHLARPSLGPLPSLTPSPGVSCPRILCGLSGTGTFKAHPSSAWHPQSASHVQPGLDRCTPYAPPKPPTPLYGNGYTTSCSMAPATFLQAVLCMRTPAPSRVLPIRQRFVWLNPLLRVITRGPRYLRVIINCPARPGSRPGSCPPFASTRLDGLWPARDL